jgi:8-oxo-dGTP pyrophosphatase MutT (NUDIX family)
MSSKIKPIPKKANLVFQGVLFDVYQWKQKMYDGSIKTFERLKRADNVMICATTADQKILLISQTQPGRSNYWTLPGGSVEKKETVLEAAKRELAEETGMCSDEWTLWLKYRFSSKIESTTYVFIAKNATNKDKINLDGGERIQAHLLDFEEFRKVSLSNNFYGLEVKHELLKTKLSKKKTEIFKKLIF